MDRTIVCAVDTRTSDEVVRVAGRLATQLDAGLLLVHVKRDPPLLPGSVEDRDRARNRLNRTAIELLDRASEILPHGLRVQYRSELGSVVGRLCRVAEKVDAILLVAGCRRRGALVTSLLGSVSHDVARHAPCPVLIVPSASPTDEPPAGSEADQASSVVVGIDGSEQSIGAAEFADELAHAFGDQVVLAHGYDAPGRIPGDIAEGDHENVHVPAVMREAMARVSGNARFVVEHGPAAHVLPAVAAREQARMIVIGSQDHHGFLPLRPAAVTAQLPRLAPCPVLVVRGEHNAGPTRVRRREPALAA